MHHKKRDNGTGPAKKERMGMQVLEEAFNGMLDAMAVADSEGNIIFWNKAAERMFGYYKEEAIGKNVHQLLAPVKYREDAKKAWGFLARQEPVLP